MSGDNVDPFKLEFSSGVKCFNGAFDSATQRVLDEQQRVLKLIQRQHPNAHATHFPVEGEWIVYAGVHAISGTFTTKGAALFDAYNRTQQP